MARHQPWQPSGIITLLTDFGLHDNYVGQVKGVILSLAPQARLVDLTHEVPPQDVLEGAFQLATAWEAFPPGTVHLAVVDPGVGTERRPVACLAGGHCFVLPDNGLGTLVFQHHPVEIAVTLDRPEHFRHPVARTFHGRDLFGPVAARLALGRQPAEVGSLIEPATLVQLDVEPVRQLGDRTTGPVVSIDRFGNCRTLIRPEHLPAPPERVLVRCGALSIRGIVRAFGDVPPGRTLALFGSHGGLEIAVREGNAARAWEIARGSLVEVLAPD
ncbi:SAM-dependent chlorinase/fluorinase [Thermomicrobiaceae bacterium CFH 74404]|uniref:SAM-dependent chlorinase/fluorinase n=1 Tax=Thermalbibacter longus TaxID=2951981 RepID=A0AA42BA12_9BACT|nr:SAM-dependent chlorinase/fluorinase [Thermalbibacter longus]MCM8749117.1 SAM-dependent chlorinase/fluorinase [Thermalbibacter longus]